MAVAGALCQSYAPVEVIVVDNGSTDDTAQELRARFGSLARYVRQTNRDTAGAYNTGLQHSHGIFVQFMDGDDVLAPTKIAAQVAAFADPGVDVVYGDVRMFQSDGGPAGWIDPALHASADIWELLLGEHVGLSALGTLWRRSALERIGRWDEALYVEDLDYFLRAAAAGCRFTHTAGGPMGFARVRRGQKTGDAAAMAQGLEAVWDKALRYVRDEPYRSRVAALAARQKLKLALDTRLPRAAALDKLRQARECGPETITPLIFHLARAAIHAPALRPAWMRRWRHAALRGFGYRTR